MDNNKMEETKVAQKLSKTMNTKGQLLNNLNLVRFWSIWE